MKRTVRLDARGETGDYYYTLSDLDRLLDLVRQHGPKAKIRAHREAHGRPFLRVEVKS